MKRFLVIAILILCCQAQGFWKENVFAEDMAQRISLDLRNIEILEALKFLAMKAGLNIIATKEVSGRVTLNVENVPVKDVFDVMLRSNGLAYVKEGDIYNVMTESEYRTLFGKKFADTRVVKVFRLKYAIPEQVFNLLDAIKSDIGRILVDPESGTVMIMDTPEKIEEIQEALKSLEQKGTIRMFSLKYARAKDVEEQLKDQLKVGSVKADERANQIIVRTLPERMKDIEALVEGLDKKTKEVLIDIKIIKIKLSDQLDVGLEWEGIFNVAGRYGMTYVGSYPFSAIQTSTDSWRLRETVFSDLDRSIGSYPFSGTITSVDDYSSSVKIKPGEKMHIGIISKKRDFDVLIKYMQTLGKTKVLSNPKIAVINNEEAKIHVGERQAYVTTTTTGQTTSTISEEVTFVDVGIQLSVTPTINDDGFITMQIKPEISSVVSVLVTSQGNKIPIVDTSLAETTVMVKDGTTIIISGLRKEEKTYSSEQFPFLGRIPLIGRFFRSDTGKTERTELLVMLTPHIITGKELDVGDKRAFGTRIGKEYRDYQNIFPKEEIRPHIEPKPYRDY